MILSILVAMTSFAVDFQAGNNVDLNQAFYVCAPSAKDVMPQIISIKDDGQRRATAAKLGCPIHMASANKSYTPSLPYKVVSVTRDICGEPTVQQGVTICGYEGHELVVQRNGVKVTVFQLSNDLSFD